MQKNYCSIFKITKTTFFDSKTLSTCYVNMRLKTAPIPMVGKTHGKYSFFISYINTQRNINGSTSFM